MTTSTYKKPLSFVSHISKPFWEAAKKHKLVLQKCGKCGTYQWYPKPWCIECGSRDLKWTEVSGRGTVYSYTIIHHTKANPAFTEDAPFSIAAVELDEGPRMYGNLVGCPPGELKIGMRVEITFDDVTDKISLPKFKTST